MQSPDHPNCDSRPAPSAFTRAHLSTTLHRAGGPRADADSDCNSSRAARNFSRRQLHALAVALLALFALGGALLLHGCDHSRPVFTEKARPAFRTAPLALRPLPEPRVWLHEAPPLTLRALEPEDVRSAIFEALCLVGGGTLAFIGVDLWRRRAVRLVLALGALSLSSCAGLHLQATVPVQGDGKASVAIDGKQIVLGFQR